MYQIPVCCIIMDIFTKKNCESCPDLEFIGLLRLWFGLLPVSPTNHINSTKKYARTVNNKLISFMYTYCTSKLVALTSKNIAFRIPESKFIPAGPSSRLQLSGNQHLCKTHRPSDLPPSLHGPLSRTKMHSARSLIRGVFQGNPPCPIQPPRLHLRFISILLEP